MKNKVKLITGGIIFYLVVIFVSIYFLLIPGISKVSKASSYKELTFEEKSKLIDEINNKYTKLVKEYAEKEGSSVIVMCAKMEEELSSLSDEDRDEYLNNGYELTDLVGISYLEKEYEEYLKGKKARYKVNKDYTLSKIEEEEKGNDLVLSIDIDIQQKVDEILKDKRR